jgi:DNA-binding transcriptional LysR family regulator
VARKYTSRLDVRRMRVLREVALHGSISEAADALHFSASAVSQQLRVLEEEAGVSLLTRAPRSLELTSAGRALVEHTDFIIERLAQAESEARAIAALRGGRLRMATFRSVGETIVAEAVTYFGNRYPDVQLTLVEGEPEDYLPGLKGADLDLGLSFEYDYVRPPGDETFERVPLLTEPMLIALPAAHRLAGGPIPRLSDLADDTWIASTARSSVHAFTHRVCEAAGFTPRLRFSTDDYHVAQSLVARELGVAFVPQMAARASHRGVVLRSLVHDQPLRGVFIAHRPDGQRSPSVAAMVATLQQAAREHLDAHGARAEAAASGRLT